MSVLGELQSQADFCRAHGSPLSAEILEIVVADYRADGVTSELLTPHHADPAGDVLGLRLLGALHYAVLDRKAPELALYYPSVGGSGFGPGLAKAVLDVVEAQGELLATRLMMTPQTNEVGRAAGLYGGLLNLPERVRLPIRLFEVGSSAGLNLRLDHFAYCDPRGIWGRENSPVRLDPAWTSSPPRWSPRIVSRLGSDPAPVALDTAGRTHLTSFVWCDQLERFDRLRHAFDVAERVPATVVQAGAAQFSSEIELREGHLTVVAHSVMGQYLSASAQRAFNDQLARLAGEATPQAPFAYLTVEPETSAPTAARRHLVTLQVWPGGLPQVLGWVPAHGVPATWSATSA